jgi:anti-anti-sigma regulatory factor/HAMP domain-containing protein
MTAVDQRSSQARLTDELLTRGNGTAQILANAANLFVANADLRGLSLLARTATTNNQAEYVAFFSARGDLLSASAAEDAAAEARLPFAGISAQPASVAAGSQRWVNGYLEITAPIIYAYKPIGTVALRLDAADLAADRARSVAQGLITALLVLLALSATVGLLLHRLVILPLRQLSVAAELIGEGTWTTPRGQERHDEIGQVARSFSQMIAALQSREAQLHEQMAAVQILNAELDTRVAARTHELQTVVDVQQRLLEQIRQMSIPVVPIQKGVVAIPLIGSLDSQRMAQLVENVLAGIQDQRAHFVAIDITGVPVIDDQVAVALVQTADSARLLGATTALVGIRPEVAQALVQIGADLSSLHTYSTLQEALLSPVARRRL